MPFILYINNALNHGIKLQQLFNGEDDYAGMADYYRTSVRYVRLCDKCCRELSGIVDKWLSDPNSGGNVGLNKWHGK